MDEWMGGWGSEWIGGWMDGFIHSFTHQYMVIEYYYVPGTPLNTSNTGISKTVAVPILME